MSDIIYNRKNTIYDNSLLFPVHPFIENNVTLVDNDMYKIIRTYKEPLCSIYANEGFLYTYYILPWARTRLHCCHSVHHPAFGAEGDLSPLVICVSREIRLPPFSNTFSNLVQNLFAYI